MSCREARYTQGREGNIGLRAFCVVLKMVLLALGLCATVQKVQKGKGPR